MFSFQLREDNLLDLLDAFTPCNNNRHAVLHQAKLRIVESESMIPLSDKSRGAGREENERLWKIYDTPGSARIYGPSTNVKKELEDSVRRLAT